MNTMASGGHGGRGSSWVCAAYALAITGCAASGAVNGGGVDASEADASATPDRPAGDITTPTDAAPPIDATPQPTDTPDVAPTDVARDVPVADVPVADVPVADVPVADVPVADVRPVDVPPADAGCGAVWPSCDVRPTAAMPATIASLWTADPMTPTFRWVSGAVVTAISRGACAAGTACQIYVQEPTGATTLAEAAHHAVKVFVSAMSSSRFVGIRVGDRVDVAAHAWRYNISGQNELLLQVADSCSLRGCMTRTGDGTLAPVPATLDALGSVMAYEYSYGPVLVRLTNVSATTDATTPLTSTTGGLFVPGAPIDAGRGEAISVSPFFMDGSRFVGYTGGQRLRFSSLVGVFGMFIPSSPAADGGVAKYLQIYPRTTADLTLMATP